MFLRKGRRREELGYLLKNRKDLYSLLFNFKNLLIQSSTGLDEHLPGV